MTETEETEPTDPDAQTPEELPSESTTAESHTAGSDDPPGADGSSPGDASASTQVFSVTDLTRNVKVGAVVVLGLLATWAILQVYTSTSRAIGIWISRDYVPIFEAAFNVVVVLIAVAGILVLVRDLV